MHERNMSVYDRFEKHKNMFRSENSYAPSFEQWQLGMYTYECKSGISNRTLLENVSIYIISNFRVPNEFAKELYDISNERVKKIVTGYTYNTKRSSFLLMG